jgi:hypothetical protein
MPGKQTIEVFSYNNAKIRGQRLGVRELVVSELGTNFLTESQNLGAGSGEQGIRFNFLSALGSTTC